MAASEQRPTPEQQHSFAPDQIRELLTFLRQESTANKDYLNNQAEADRQLLKHTLWIVALPLTSLIVIAGIFGFKSISDLKESIRTQAEAETKTEIARMRQDTDNQITAMQLEIRNRLNQQFQNPVISGLVKNAAKEQAQTTAEPLIKGEVGKEVKRRVDAEQGTIKHIVSDQTQAAVKQMGAQIDDQVKSAVDARLQPKFRAVEEQLSDLKEETQVQLLINRMNADDAMAYDTFNHMNLTSMKPEQRGLIISAVRSIVVARTGLLVSRGFKVPHTDEQLVTELSSTDPLSRVAALDTLRGKKKPELFPKIVDMLQHDSSLDVRAAAYRLFNMWTEQDFQFLFDEPKLISWWNEHKDKLMH